MTQNTDPMVIYESEILSIRFRLLQATEEDREKIRLIRKEKLEKLKHRAGLTSGTDTGRMLNSSPQEKE